MGNNLESCWASLRIFILKYVYETAPSCLQTLEQPEGLDLGPVSYTALATIPFLPSLSV